MAPSTDTTTPVDETRTDDAAAQQHPDWTPLANPRRVRI